jgi:hypothetical protein
MERKMYEPTENQERKWASLNLAPLPSDDEFKTRWAKAHHGKTAGWGMMKRDWIVSNLKNSREYQMGIWQGRVDRARGLEYSEERNDNTYNLGYYRGYTDYESNRRGWDRQTRKRFDEKYVNS